MARKKAAKKKPVKKKRKATPAQLRALAKARKARVQRKHTISGKRKVAAMPRKRSSRRRKTSHRKQIVVLNSPGRPRRHRRRSRGYLHGLPRSKHLTGATMDLGVTLAGALVGSIAAGRIPIKDPRIRAAIPLVAGLLGGTTMKSPIMKHALNGVAIGGGLALIKQFAPQLGLAGALETIEGEENLKLDSALQKEISSMMDKQNISGEIMGEEAYRVQGADLEGEIEGEMEGEIMGEERYVVG